MRSEAAETEHDKRVAQAEKSATLHKAEKIVRQAVLQIHMHMPFYGSLLAKMHTKFTDKVPTAGVDGTNKLYMNPEFFASMTWKEAGFVLLHEADHKALLHPYRCGTRDPFIWNLAGDALINKRLIDLCQRRTSGLLTPFHMPKPPNEGFLLDWVDTNKMTTEEIYERLLRDGKPKNANKLGFGGGKDVDTSGPAVDEAKSMQLEAQALQDIIEAAGHAKQMGLLPSYIQQFLEELPEAMIDWREELPRMIYSTLGFDDWSYRRLRRSPLAIGIIAPSLFGAAINNVVIVVDTSGSFVSLIKDAYAEVKAILTQVNPRKTTVIQCDADVADIKTYSTVSELEAEEIEWHGGGGTDFRPAFNAIAEMEQPDAIVYITDAYGEFPDEEVPNTIWCLIGNSGSVPWGKVLHINE